MPATVEQTWKPGFDSTTPLFRPLRLATAPFSAQPDWPTLIALNQALDHCTHRPHTLSGQLIQFVPQSVSTAALEDKYEPRIFLKGEVQTRTNNWHDFFNALVWMSFPQTKAVLNGMQYEQFRPAEPVRQNRTPVQDALTIFDEGGAMVVSRDDSLLDLLRAYAWKELFWTQRQRVQRDMQFYVFGHALYEKALTPYAGMTAKCVLLRAESNFFTTDLAAQLYLVDEWTAAWFRHAGMSLRTGMLSPLPILGVPGWSPENQSPDYYDDKQYFRDQYQRA